MPGLPRAWWQAQLAAANMPPVQPRLAFLLNGIEVGSVAPGFLDEIANFGMMDGRFTLQKSEQNSWHLTGTPDAALAALAQTMRALGHAGAWRNELLAVCDAAGVRHGVIERAAVRPLGLTTHAVHLLGHHPDGRMWVQQRAANKATDPGRWDTLVGGMVPAHNDVHTALLRESGEEAGLAPAQLQHLGPWRRLRVVRPTADAGGIGQVIEDIDWTDARLPGDAIPENQDGEVQGFALLDWPTLCDWLRQDRFTLDASLMLGRFLLDNGVPLHD